ncbi:hypothetical protein EK21DRAFT_118434 [Setomelanomma holmii]|uniref:Uncharacterized protein n=1 Tax=Setomelanomma holmii TaxID=210430 RepID=A0A9P4GXG1_9PLEO|nr:hypothetical protein EK21DRAFT_118434 [Setomelanomma holmii]
MPSPSARLSRQPQVLFIDGPRLCWAACTNARLTSSRLPNQPLDSLSAMTLETASCEPKQKGHLGHGEPAVQLGLLYCTTQAFSPVTLRAGEWNICFNPAAVAASQEFDTWLGPPGIEHGSLEGACRLTLEAGLQERVTEVADSDDENNLAGEDGSSYDDDGDGEPDGHGSTGQLAITSNTHAAHPPTALQSLDLLQIFQLHRTQL